jgi:hypothetical protein
MPYIVNNPTPAIFPSSERPEWAIGDLSYFAPDEATQLMEVAWGSNFEVTTTRLLRGMLNLNKTTQNKRNKRGQSMRKKGLMLHEAESDTTVVVQRPGPQSFNIKIMAPDGPDY